MPARFTKIDDLTRAAHYHLTPDDDCYYLREYTSHKGSGASDTNNLILNFKKEPDRVGRPEWRYKEEAVRQLAAEFKAANAISGGWTWVPIPPSRTKSDPLYDDRLLWMLRVMGRGETLDVRELISQTGNIRAAHSAATRLRPEEIAAHYAVDESVADPFPKGIILFDDVLTTGAHFKAAKRILEERFPGIRIIGVFIARRTFG